MRPSGWGCDLVRLPLLVDHRDRDDALEAGPVPPEGLQSATQREHLRVRSSVLRGRSYLGEAPASAGRSGPNGAIPCPLAPKAR